MFFRKRVTVADYCAPKLSALVSDDSARSWTKFKNESSDPALKAASIKEFADELLAAHIQLLSLAITKTFRSIDISMAAYSQINSFLEANSKAYLSELKDKYNQAFGSSAADGVLQMARLLNMNLTGGKLDPRTVEAIRDLMYRALAAYFVDFKSVKLVKP